MDKRVAQFLCDELSRHPKIIKPDTALFLDLLIAADIPESKRFYEILPEHAQLVQETDQYFYLSLRRILRNKNARNYHLHGWKKAYETGASALRMYSSDALTRNLRTDEDIVELMATCEQPFSLLGKFETYDYA
ncbi:MAG: hypothetical protein V1743_06620, partial [Nanoarchaeota archaeon]